MRKPVVLFAFGILALLPLGCDHGERIARLEKQNQELQAEIKKNQAAADYDMQAKCGRDSKIWFNENWQSDKNTVLLTYTNHYNKVQNKCFVLVEYHYSIGVYSSWVSHLSLWDVYENSKYGEFSVTHMISIKPTFTSSELVGLCEVYGKKCKTADEFKGLIQPYLNN